MITYAVEELDFDVEEIIKEITKKLEEKDSLSSLEQWNKWIEEAKSMI